jgi:hypothetical protein
MRTSWRRSSALSCAGEVAARRFLGLDLDGLDLDAIAPPGVAGGVCRVGRRANVVAVPDCRRRGPRIVVSPRRAGKNLLRKERA